MSLEHVQACALRLRKREETADVLIGLVPDVEDLLRLIVAADDSAQRSAGGLRDVEEE
jgi:hypothetical protein